MHRPIGIVLAVALVFAACGTEESADATTSLATTTVTDPTSTTTTSTTTTSSTTTTTTLPPIEDPYVVVNGARLVYRCEFRPGPGSSGVSTNWWSSKTGC